MKKIICVICYCLLTVLIANSQNSNPIVPSDSNPQLTNSPKIGVGIGEIAPDISLSSPTGKNLNLYSLRGKLVLLDFWASWCGPCRSENPNLVRIYNVYKDSMFTKGKGFTIYSVSLDAQLSSWQAAISRDSLIWQNHVSDLLLWQSPYVTLYKIQGIPMNFLIDENGIIIAKNLRGANLETVLKMYLK